MANKRKTSALASLGISFMPRKVRPILKEYLQKTGMVEPPYAAYATLILISIIGAVIGYTLYLLPVIRGFNPVLLFLTSFTAIVAGSAIMVGFVVMVFYFYFDMRIYSRTREMETHLPEYLQVVSTNLKGGMSFEKSLFAAIRPQFGVLSHEMAIAAKKVMTGHDMVTALDEFSNKYDSPQLKRSLNLIVGEVTTGGKVAYVIDEVVSGLKATKRLKDEMSTSVITYVIFIGAIVGVIAPALFALSFNLLSFMSQFTDKLAGQDLNTVQTPFNFTEGAIDPSKFKTFSWVATLTVAVMSAMIVSVIEKGHIRAGIKYIPIFAASSLTLYFIFMWILGKLFSAISI